MGPWRVGKVNRNHDLRGKGRRGGFTSWSGETKWKRGEERRSQKKRKTSGARDIGIKKSGMVGDLKPMDAEKGEQKDIANAQTEHSVSRLLRQRAVGTRLGCVYGNSHEGTSWGWSGNASKKREFWLVGP